MSGLLAGMASAAVLLSFITAVLGTVNQRRIRTAAQTAQATAAKVDVITVNVDGRLSQLIERQAQLLGALSDSGVPVPPRPPDPAPPPDPGPLPCP